MTDVIIVGGGASGLVCGIEALRRGKRCIILEQMEKPGKKLYATGNGRCNFANRLLLPDCYRSVESKSQAVRSQILHKDICADTELFFREIGIPAAERQGYLYPRSEQAASLVHALEQTYLQEGGSLYCGCRVDAVSRKGDTGAFLVRTVRQNYESQRLVLATGGQASPELGSDGSGYRLARAFGHRVTACVPALCGLKVREQGWSRLQGVRAKGQITLWQEDIPMGQETGEIQFTKYGLSGIAVFNLSRYGALGLRQKQLVTVTIDFLPDYKTEDFTAAWRGFQNTCGRRNPVGILSGFLPEKLAAYLIELGEFRQEESCAALTEQEIHRLASLCKEFQVKITGINGYGQAQVTAGGVSLQEICPDTMESNRTPGLFLTGELLDADGICGGYNLMWAWETGRRAGRGL